MGISTRVIARRPSYVLRPKKKFYRIKINFFIKNKKHYLSKAKD